MKIEDLNPKTPDTNQPSTNDDKHGPGYYQTEHGLKYYNSEREYWESEELRALFDEEEGRERNRLIYQSYNPQPITNKIEDLPEDNALRLLHDNYSSDEKMNESLARSKPRV